MRAGEEEKPLWPRSSPCLKNIHAMDMQVLRFYETFFFIRCSRERLGDAPMRSGPIRDNRYPTAAERATGLLTTRGGGPRPAQTRVAAAVAILLHGRGASIARVCAVLNIDHRSDGVQR